MDPLLGAGLALFVCAVAGLATGRIARYQADGLFAIMDGLFSIDDIRLHEMLPAVWCAACCAWFTHRWWTGGGGDGTRRRLRSLRRKFEGVRRTAPQLT